MVALTGASWSKLIAELHSPVGPVNLAATAKKYGISRGTLLKYVKEQPGLFEALQARRKDQGRGYVPVKRGTRQTRAAAKQRLAEQVAQPWPAPSADPPMNPAVAQKLDAFLKRLDADQHFQAEMEGEGRLYVPSSTRRVIPDGAYADVLKTFPKPKRDKDGDF